MRKLFYLLLSGMLICPNIVSVSAATSSSYNKLTSEEKKAFDKIYKTSADSTLESVSVDYSASVDGRNDVNNWHWTAWHKVAKGAGISKNANSGAGVGSGSYSGFTKKKVESWKMDDAHIQAIKDMNKGKFPESRNYSYPMNTSSAKFDFWMDRVGYYDIMGDPRYRKVTMNGYRTFKWTEKVKKEKIIKNSTTDKAYAVEGVQALGQQQGFYIGWVRSNKFSNIVGESPEKVAQKICSSIKKTEIKEGENKGRYNAKADVQFINGNTKINLKISIFPSETNEGIGQGRLLYDVKFNWSEETTKVSYETKTHTNKQRIAKTSIPANTYASEIQKYGYFYLTPKSSVSSNKIRKENGGFWLNVNPYYHHSSPSVTNEGNYNWTFSTNVSGGKAIIILYSNIIQKWKFIEDIADNILFPNTPGVNNPPIDGNGSGGNHNNNNNNSNNGGSNGGNNNHGGGDSSNGNNGGDGSGNDGSSSGKNNGSSTIGDEKNSPMIHVEIDANEPAGRKLERTAITIHLFDIDRYEKEKRKK